MDKIAIEDTQGLIKKDLLLDWDDDINKETVEG